jgi:shikimate kinase
VIQISEALAGGPDRPAAERPRSVWLIGLMGSGKSTAGRVLAERLRWIYVDNDVAIAEMAGRSTVELSEAGGTLLHDWESRYVKGLVAGAHPVVAGIPASTADLDANLRLLADSGNLVYLRCDADTLVARIKADGRRPWLVDDEVRQQVEAMLAAREPHILRFAHHVVDSSAPVAQVVDQLMAIVGK